MKRGMKRVLKKIHEVIGSMEMEHHVVAFSALGGPLSLAMNSAALFAAHRVKGRFDGKFCSVCWDLEPFDAPLV